MIKSPICEMLGIKYPIFQGGMAWVADADLAVAVSEAGGLGIIAGMNLDGQALRAEIRKASARTDKAFGVNLMLQSPYIDEAVKVVCEEKVACVTTGAGNPSKYLKDLREAGVKVIPVVASVALARMMEREGVCALVAEGTESGGHVGELTTMALIPQIVDAVKIPVIAAGGIADGRGFAAALMLGACGVQMGTRFLAASECNIHANYKDRVVKARDIDTIVTGKKGGHPVRVLKNQMTRDYYKKEMEGLADADELHEMTKDSLRRAVREGDVNTGSCMCGQIAGLIDQVKPCREIIEDIDKEASQLLNRASSFLD
jgi:enoyl-[acyl-carrier protein] reductase II